MTSDHFPLSLHDALPIYGRWQHYWGTLTYLLLAGLSTPLVLSVHSIVSLDFAVGIIPGWHTTIFPPYFVEIGRAHVELQSHHDLVCRLLLEKKKHNTVKT